MLSGGSDKPFAQALRVLLRGFPGYAAQEFEQAKSALSPPVAQDLAQAIVSDTVLVLSQFGPAVIGGSLDRVDTGTVLLDTLRAIQQGKLDQAADIIRCMGTANPSQMLSLRVLAKRLTVAGVIIRAPSRLNLQVIQGGGQRRLARPRHAEGLRLISSR